jgi:hypothetical protein
MFYTPNRKREKECRVRAAAAKGATTHAAEEASGEVEREADEGECREAVGEAGRGVSMEAGRD